MKKKTLIRCFGLDIGQEATFWSVGQGQSDITHTIRYKTDSQNNMWKGFDR